MSARRRLIADSAISDIEKEWRIQITCALKLKESGNGYSEEEGYQLLLTAQLFKLTVSTQNLR